jgi:lysozyme
MQMKDIAALLEKHEGFRKFVYNDSVGIPTIGIGRNLKDRGITRAEALYLLENDIKDFTTQLQNRLYWFDNIHDHAKVVLVDMAFNLGLNGLLTFKTTLEHIKNENYDAAAVSMLQSKWAKQVGSRAIELSEILTNIKNDETIF